MEWQFHPSLGISYSKHLDQDFGLFDHFLTIGPFQFCWKSIAAGVKSY